MTTPEWIRELFASIDAMDADRFASFLSDDARFCFGNAPEVFGKESIRESVVGFFGNIKGLRHDILGTWTHSDTVICQGEVTYTRVDDSHIKLPFMNLFGMQDDRIKEYLIYIDITSLFAPD